MKRHGKKKHKKARHKSKRAYPPIAPPVKSALAPPVASILAPSNSAWENLMRGLHFEHSIGLCDASCAFCDEEEERALLGLEPPLGCYRGFDNRGGWRPGSLPSPCNQSPSEEDLALEEDDLTQEFAALVRAWREEL